MATTTHRPESSIGEALRWRPGARVARLRASHSYGFVLLLVAACFVFIAVAPETGWSRIVLVLLQTTTLAVALWTSGFGRAALLASVGLLALAAAAILVEVAAQNDTSVPSLGLLNAFLIVAVCAVIVVGVADQRDVNAQTVLGAICVYLQIGMFFVFLYSAIAALSSDPFFADGTDGTLSIRLYFSFVTLTTVGYGDYTAGGDLGRALAAVEALFGQLYLVTVVSVVVGLMVGKRRPSG